MAAALACPKGSFAPLIYAEVDNVALVQLKNLFSAQHASSPFHSKRNVHSLLERQKTDATENM
jgi:hypothetical protein